MQLRNLDRKPRQELREIRDRADAVKTACT